MGKLIINNRSDAPDGVALSMVIDCIKLGRISNYGKQYCYARLCSVSGKQYMIYSDLNKASDSFTIINHLLPEVSGE